MAKVCCKGLLLARSANFIMHTFVFVSHEIFLARLFCTPRLLCPEATAPAAALSYVTASVLES